MADNVPDVTDDNVVENVDAGNADNVDAGNTDNVDAANADNVDAGNTDNVDAGNADDVVEDKKTEPQADVSDKQTEVVEDKKNEDASKNADGDDKKNEDAGDKADKKSDGGKMDMKKRYEESVKAQAKPTIKKRKKRKSVSGKLNWDDETLEAINKVYNDKKDKDVNVCIFEASLKSNKFYVIKPAFGTGGLPQLYEFLEARQDKLCMGLLRIIERDDQGSNRAKFLYFKMLNETKVPVMVRAKSTTYLPQVKNHFKTKHIERTGLDENYTKDLDPKRMAHDLLRFGGSDKPTEIDFGGGLVFDVKTTEMKE